MTANTYNKLCTALNLNEKLAIDLPLQVSKRATLKETVVIDGLSVDVYQPAPSLLLSKFVALRVEAFKAELGRRYDKLFNYMINKGVEETEARKVALDLAAIDVPNQDGSEKTLDFNYLDYITASDYIDMSVSFISLDALAEILLNGYAYLCIKEPKVFELIETADITLEGYQALNAILLKLYDELLDESNTREDEVEIVTTPEIV